MKTRVEPDAPEGAQASDPFDSEEDSSVRAPTDEDVIDPLPVIRAAADFLAGQTQRHPYRTLGIAVGVGYILGGGLPRFVVRMAGLAALRTASHAVLTSDTAVAVARSLFEAAGGTRAPIEAPRRRSAARDSGGRFTA